jgi:hypothetical protein
MSLVFPSRFFSTKSSQVSYLLVQVARERVIKAAAVDVNKTCLLSLSGKSTLVIYDTADSDSAIEAIVDGCLYANGQVIQFDLGF